MSLDLYKKLAWLPRSPPEFAAMCKTILAGGDGTGKRIQAAAMHGLDENQLARLGRCILAARKTGDSLAPLVPFKLGLLGNGTLDLIVPALVASAARYGIVLDCVKGAYDQFLQDAMSPHSEVNRARPDAVLLSLDYRGLNLQPAIGNADAASASVAEARDLLHAVRAGVKQHSGSLCIVQTLAPPPEGLFGSLDRALPGTPRNLIDELNRQIIASLAASGDVLLDVAALAETVGLAEWHSPSLWNMAKLPFADGFVPLYADHVARIIAAMRGKSRRCLVLDLDNTIWGGIVGDDGLEGLKMAQGDAIGEAHLSVQRMALDLRERGVVLAVCSKNTDGVARRPFAEHPDMLLREDHVAVFQANWSDKATNIRAIAEELALGLDSLVFLDDNPAERALIRRELPQVAVPELEADPANYARTLAAAGYFEATGFSDEDRGRAEMYQGNARRLTLQRQTTDIDSYLRSLDMRIVFAGFDRTTLSRIVQLINKSNQFNLTTRRYTEVEIATLAADPGNFILQARLVDSFGDNGIICVVICRSMSHDTWEIDTWLMSCRVLGRRVEHMVLREIQHHARARGIGTLVGIYRPTERNAMVRDHFAKLGFSHHGEDQAGTTRWALSTDAEVEAAPMVVERIAPEWQLSERA